MGLGRSLLAALVVVGGIGVLAGQQPGPSTDAARPSEEIAKPDLKPDANALSDARAALGEGGLQSIRFSGAGTVATIHGGDTDASPRAVTSYEVLIDYPASTMQIDVVSATAGDAALTHHVEAITGTLAWDAVFVTMPATDAAHKKGHSNDHPSTGRVTSSESPRLNAAESPVRGQGIWMTPHGFLKAALANQPALRAAGSGTEVSFFAGTHRYVGFLNSKHQVERVRTWVPRAEIGDLLIDTTYTDYALFGDVSFPTRIRQLRNGRPMLDVTITSVQANAPVKIAVPKNLLQ